MEMVSYGEHEKMVHESYDGYDVMKMKREECYSKMPILFFLRCFVENGIFLGGNLLACNFDRLI